MAPQAAISHTQSPRSEIVQGVRSKAEPPFHGIDIIPVYPGQLWIRPARPVATTAPHAEHEGLRRLGSDYLCRDVFPDSQGIRRCGIRNWSGQNGQIIFGRIDTIYVRPDPVNGAYKVRQAVVRQQEDVASRLPGLLFRKINYGRIGTIFPRGKPGIIDGDFAQRFSRLRHGRAKGQHRH